ncbi:hypothetical protein VJI72_04750 [Parvimonas micra]|uniref:hypothetical protein n=1 Tax=Parvimonas micra TaxID=33033 RepID=UPI002B49716A|nr:hypothetical protein [Parvimonas micra]MEB3029099.1 hypothetical protein [Parvimonas micra]
MIVKVINRFYNKEDLKECFEKDTLLKINDEDRALDLIARDLVIEVKLEDENALSELKELGEKVEDTTTSKENEKVDNAEEEIEEVVEKKEPKGKSKKGTKTKSK